MSAEAGLNWVAVGAIAGPVVAALALWAATREKKVDLLARRTETLIGSMERRIQSLEEQVEECDKVTARLRREVRELRSRVDQ